MVSKCRVILSHSVHDQRPGDTMFLFLLCGIDDDVTMLLVRRRYRSPLIGQDVLSECYHFRSCVLPNSLSSPDAACLEDVSRRVREDEEGKMNNLKFNPTAEGEECCITHRIVVFFFPLLPPAALCLLSTP